MKRFIGINIHFSHTASFFQVTVLLESKAIGFIEQFILHFKQCVCKYAYTYECFFVHEFEEYLAKFLPGLVGCILVQILRYRKEEIL